MSRSICLITGTTNGIGRVTAEGLAARGFEVVMACRNLERAETVREAIVGKTGNEAVHVLHCDLADLTTVREAAAAVLEGFERLDLLVNNAGTMTSRFQQNRNGLELTFAANYLGPWLLTRLLLDRLVASAPARIVTVASAVHRQGALATDSLADERSEGFSGMGAYARSKLGNVMATLTQAELLQGTGVTANCLHPGVVATNITSDTNTLLRLGMKLAGPFMLNDRRGAATSLFLATDPQVAATSGSYFDEKQQVQDPAPAATDAGARRALWTWSSRFCEVPERWTPAP